MADSCRPVSRHGRYNAAGPSAVQYTGDMSSFGNVDYTPSEEMYTVNQSGRPERPKTSRGRRRRADPPPRPESRRGGQPSFHPDPDEESSGRPISRVGFSPDSAYRYSHDEYSRQVSSDSEKPIVNSPCSSPEILYQDEQYFANQKALLQQPSPEPTHIDRLIVSPTTPRDILGGNSKKRGKSPQVLGQSPSGYSQSPRHQHHSPHRESPQGYNHSPSRYQRPSSKEPVRPTSREYLTVSPLQRDEDQIQVRDLHDSHRGRSEDPYMQEGDVYQQRFSESPQYRNSPYHESPQVTSYRDSPQYRNSPYQENPQVTSYRDSPQYRDSPSYNTGSPYHNPSPTHGSYSGYTGSPDSRPPPAPRPKSSRPKTARKKSARARQQHHRYQEQETSPPQQCDTSSILNSGDPYGRPSSSLSPYKPLPAIGASTPRSPDRNEHEGRKPYSSSSDTGSRNIDNVTVETKRMMLEESAQYHLADEHSDIFSVEDIQNGNGENFGQFSGQGIPSVDMLTNFPQHLSSEIYKSSFANFEKRISGEENASGDHYMDIEHNETNQHQHEMNQHQNETNQHQNDSNSENQTATVKPLDFLHELPQEPQEGDPRLLLAIKLPDGKRIQRYFSPLDYLKSVMHFAENTNLVSYEDFQIVCNAPKTRFDDLDTKIQDTPLRDRTVLYLEEKD